MNLRKNWILVFGGGFLVLAFSAAIFGLVKSLADDDQEQSVPPASIKSEPAEVASTTSNVWNMEDPELATNGNLPVAIAALNSGLVKLPAKVSAEVVFKRPWDFYGKEVCLTGTAAIVQDFPPGNEVSQLFGGSVSEIVMLTTDGTVVDGILKGTTGNVSVGDEVSICGTPAGRIEVDNQLGGKTTQLALVGALRQ